MDKTSMCYWYPKVEQLELAPVKVPPTTMIEQKTDIMRILGESDADFLSEPGIQKRCDMHAIVDAVSIHKLPVFFRTDQTSHKHAWDKTCYIKDYKGIIPAMQELMCFHQLMDILDPPKIRAWVVRKYIKMATIFRAFNGTPINPEWRLFVKDGEVICAHWYWIEDAIKDHNTSTSDWTTQLESNCMDTQSDVDSILTRAAMKIGGALKGSWSLDFCMGSDGTWWFIDAAEAYKSWHDDSCTHKGAFAHE